MVRFLKLFQYVLLDLLVLLSLSGCSCSTDEVPMASFVPIETMQEDEQEAYEIKGNTVYLNRTTSLFYVKAEGAETMIIDGAVGLEDINLDPMGDHIVPTYDSYFRGCPNIKKIVVTDGTFQKCEANGELFVEDNMLMYNNPKKGVYACPVTKEGKVKIPEGTWEIYDCAFQRCEKIEEVVIPASVRWVGDAAFGYNTGCQKISVDKDSKYLKSVDGVLYTKDGKVLLAYPAGKKDTVFRVPYGVQYIADGAFIGAVKLKQVSLPKNLFYIGEKVFMDCKNLEKVSAEGKVTFIMKSAYENCMKLKFKNRPKRKKYSNTWDVAIADSSDRQSTWECNYKYLAYMETAYRWKYMYHYLGGE